MSVARRRAMVDRLHPQLSIVRQCALLQISRSGRYFQPVGESEPTLSLMR
jgi:putative transposase